MDFHKYPKALVGCLVEFRFITTTTIRTLSGEFLGTSASGSLYVVYVTQATINSIRGINLFGALVMFSVAETELRTCKVLT